MIQQQQTEKLKLSCFHCPAWLGSAERDPSKKSQLATSDAQKHAPRSPAGAQTCAAVYTRSPCVPCSREREKRPAAGGEELDDVQKTCILFIYM